MRLEGLTGSLGKCVGGRRMSPCSGGDWAGEEQVELERMRMDLGRSSRLGPQHAGVRLQS